MVRNSQEASGPWIVVKEWAGGASAEPAVEVFASPGGRWRLSYRTEADEQRSGGVIDVILRGGQDDRIVSAVYNLQGTVSGFLTADSEHAEYRVEVRSHGPRWRVAVERSD